MNLLVELEVLLTGIECESPAYENPLFFLVYSSGQDTHLLRVHMMEFLSEYEQ